MSYPKISLYLIDPKIDDPVILPIDCHDIIHDSYFIKKMNQYITIPKKKITELAISVTHPISSEIVPVVQWLLSSNIMNDLNRKVIFESGEIYQTSYVFSGTGSKKLLDLRTDTIQCLLLIFDSIDISPILTALVNLLIDNKVMHLNEIYSYIYDNRLATAKVYFK